MKNINQLNKYSKLLKRIEIQKILENIFNGYELKYLDTQNDQKIKCTFKDNKLQKKKLIVTPNVLNISSSNENTKEFVEIQLTPEHNIMVQKYICEKRDRGVIVTLVKEFYQDTIYSDEEKMLTDVYEYRYAFRNDRLKFIYDNITPATFEDITSKNVALICFGQANIETDFSAHMKRIITYPYGGSTSDMRPSKVLINDDNIAYYFDMIDGPDKVKRVHDLYNGLINENTKEDIKLINLGCLSSDGFDFRTFTGITGAENLIVGEPPELTDEYKEQVKKIFKEVLDYTGEIKFDRLNLIHYMKYPSGSCNQNKTEQTKIEQNKTTPQEEPQHKTKKRNFWTRFLKNK